jgi:signal transduction histidine kinase
MTASPTEVNASPEHRVRELTEELSHARAELGEARAQQAATAEILRVISSSPTDLQRVFAEIAASAARFCDAYDAAIHRVDGDFLAVVAHHGPIPVPSTLPLMAGSFAGRTVLDQRTIHVADVQTATDEYPEGSGRATGGLGFRTILAVPLIRAGKAIGVISIRRPDLRAFTDREIELLKTFADQAVIAIENVRLFEAERARNAELTENRARETATGEVLRAIIPAQTDAQPVFDIIAGSALRLCGAGYGQVAIYDGEWLHLVALHDVSPEGVEVLRRRFPVRADHGSAMGRAIQTRAVVQIPDVLEDPAYGFKSELVTMGFRSILVVPMLLKCEPIGAIAVGRREPGPFSVKQVELLKTFADQAVVAVENVRLFTELEARTRELARSVGELNALSQVGQTISTTLELKAVLNAILMHACRLADSGGGAIYVFAEARGEFDLEAAYNMGEDLVTAVRKRPIRLGETLVGQCGERREPVQIEDLAKAAPNPLFEMHLNAGVRALLGVPLLHLDKVVGALVVRRKEIGAFPPETVNLLQAFATQSAIAIHNARLFYEIKDKSRELEIASQHKSQFVANMSHELRTPLAAILGYAELMQEGFYGALPEKSMASLTRIRSNGKHLLGLINTVLDIAKIEAGQFSLNLGEYAIESMVETVRAATESLAETKKISLKTDIAKRLPIGLGDEQRLTQVLLNLVGNAIKFTDTGEVRITATAVNGHFTVAVTDTGPGIPPDELKRVFEQFHQIDNSNTKAKVGTGLGLAIAKQIVEMHGGRIWVESTLGKGATFQMELPVRAAAGKGAA